MEIRIRIYFGLYFMYGAFECQSRNTGEALEKTKIRIKHLKKYLGEHCDPLVKDVSLQKYMRICDAVANNSINDNEELEFFVSDKFYHEVYRDVFNEVEKIVFFIKEVYKNRSYLTRVYEFYAKNHQKLDGDANGSFNNEPVISDKNLENIENENFKLEADIKDIGIIHEKLQVKFDELKIKLIGLTCDIKKKESEVKETDKKLVFEQNLKPVILEADFLNKDVQKKMNRIWLEKHKAIQKLAQDYKKLIRQKKKGILIPAEKSHIDVLAGKLFRLKESVSKNKLIDEEVVKGFEDVRKNLVL